MCFNIIIYTMQCNATILSFTVPIDCDLSSIIDDYQTVYIINIAIYYMLVVDREDESYHYQYQYEYDYRYESEN
jgi:hypothetical protein